MSWKLQFDLDSSALRAGDNYAAITHKFGLFWYDSNLWDKQGCQEKKVWYIDLHVDLILIKRLIDSNIIDISI